MANVRTKSLGIFDGTAPIGSTPLYTVPLDETTIVKYLTAYTTDAGARVFVWVRPGTSGAITHVWSVVPGATGTAQLSSWVVLQPGWQLGWVVTGTGAVRLTASGTELEGVAD